MKLEFNKLRGVLAVAAVAMVFGLATMAHAQCTPPLFQGYPSSCSTINLRWLNRDPISLIDRFEIYRGGVKVGETPGSAITWSERVGCGFGATYTIKQVMKTGATCQVVTSGNPPHTAPCSLCGANGGGNQTSIVSAANFRPFVARNSVASIFPDPGTSFTDRSETAFSMPLPTTLAGVTVEIGNQLCPLFAVTPGQINFLLPDWLAEGPTEVMATIRTTRGSVGQFFGRPQLNPNAPGIFTLSASGSGPAASNWVVVKPNGQQVYYGAHELRFSAGDSVVLVLYGTGINESTADLILGNGRTVRAQYCGPSWMPGVQQMNFLIPTNQLWTGEIGAFVRVYRPGVGHWDGQGVGVIGIPTR